MKIIGLTLAQVSNVLLSQDMWLNWKAQGDGIKHESKGVVEGFMSYKVNAKTPYKCKVNGEWHHKPCFHMTRKVVKALGDAGASDVYAEKVHFHGKGNYNTAEIMLATKFHAKGITCECPEHKGAVHTLVAGKIVATVWNTPLANPEMWVCNDNFGVHGVKGNGQSFDVSMCTPHPEAAHMKGKAALTCPYCKTYNWYDNKILHHPMGWTGTKSVKVKATPAPKPEPKVVSIETFNAAPLAGDPITEGETSILPSRNNLRHTMAAVTGLYVLQELSMAIDTLVEYPMVVNANGQGTRIDRSRILRARGESAEHYNIPLRVLWGEFREFKREYEARLARNLFDYLVMACAGESRYDKYVQAWGGVQRPHNRAECWQGAIKFDPRTILPVIEQVFSKGSTKVGGGYGGKKWANIAKSAGYYFKFREFPVVFADHVVDLVHNGGLAWNKGYIMAMPNEGRFMAMLERKKHASLLDWKGETITLPIEVWSMLERVRSLAPARVSYSVVDGETVETVVDGLKVTAKLAVVNDPEVKLIKWGSEPFTVGGMSDIQVKQAEDENEESDDDEEETHQNTYVTAHKYEEYPETRPEEIPA
jgi:hypothetical protein